MFIHQVHNSIGEEVYNAFVYRGVHYHTHVHKGFEFVYVLKGTLQASVDETEYHLIEGEGLFITPYRLHSYDSTNCVCFIVVFSGTFIEHFSRAFAKKISSSARVLLDGETKGYILKNLVGKNVDPPASIAVKKPDVFTLKACLYAVAAAFAEQNEFEEKTGKDAVIFRILMYVENNYLADISLKTMAKELGYDYQYLSRIFHRSFGINFKTLVNQYRAERAAHLIASTDSTLSEIALNSGFQSIRTFNRVFKETTGSLPSEIRK